MFKINARPVSGAFRGQRKKTMSLRREEAPARQALTTNVNSNGRMSLISSKIMIIRVLQATYKRSRRWTWIKSSKERRNCSKSMGERMRYAQRGTKHSNQTLRKNLTVSMKTNRLCFRKPDVRQQLVKAGSDRPLPQTKSWLRTAFRAS